MTYILIVDDEPRFAQPAKHVLVQEGFEVELAYSIDEARESITVRIPDGIILDVLFPSVAGQGMEDLGFQFLKTLKGDEATKDIAVVMYTVVFDANSRRICRKMGAVDYLRKSAGGEQIVTAFKKAGIIPSSEQDGNDAHFTRALVKRLESLWHLYDFRFACD